MVIYNAGKRYILYPKGVCIPEYPSIETFLRFSLLVNGKFILACNSEPSGDPYLSGGFKFGFLHFFFVLGKGQIFKFLQFFVFENIQSIGSFKFEFSQ